MNRITPHWRALAPRLRKSLTVLSVVALAMATMVVANQAVSSAAGTTSNGDATCGYPDSSNLNGGALPNSKAAFNESTLTQWAQVNGHDPATATIGVYTTDEWGLLLGVGPNVSKAVTASQTALTSALTVNVTYTSISVQALQAPVSLNDVLVVNNGAGKTQNLKASAAAAVGATSISIVSAKAGATFPVGSVVSNTTHPVVSSHVQNPNLGNPALLDTTQRPQYPALYVSDISANPTNIMSNRSGDWQQGGSPVNLTNGTPWASDVFGQWTTADIVNGTYTKTSVPQKNNWTLGPGSDTPTAVSGTNTGFAALSNEGYGSETRWNVSTLVANGAVQAGHVYRVQVLSHDGDQNNTGGDAGEYCTILKIPGPPQIKTAPDSGFNGNGDFHVKAPVGSAINDFAQLTGSLGTVTGNVTFNLYFVPTGTTLNNPADACTAQYKVTSYSSTKTLSNGAATSDPYTSGTALGTYYWQDVYDPNGDPNYTAATETCGNETVQLVAARVRLSPPSAVNIINNPHTITATVETTTDGTTYTPEPGATVTFSYVGSTSATPNPPAACDGSANHPKTDANGQCSTTINDGTVETVVVHAVADFTDTQLGGHFNVTTGNQGCGAVGQTGTTTCDATKQYINPKTQLTVSDQLIGLGSDATGTVTYKWFTSTTDCASDQNGHDAGGGSITTPGTAPKSADVTVSPGETKYFVAYYSGNEGTFHTDCTAESASSAS